MSVWDVYTFLSEVWKGGSKLFNLETGIFRFRGRGSIILPPREHSVVTTFA